MAVNTWWLNTRARRSGRPACASSIKLSKSSLRRELASVPPFRLAAIRFAFINTFELSNIHAHLEN